MSGAIAGFQHDCPFRYISVSTGRHRYYREVFSERSGSAAGAVSDQGRRFLVIHPDGVKRGERVFLDYSKFLAANNLGNFAPEAMERGLPWWRTGVGRALRTSLLPPLTPASSGEPAIAILYF